MHIKYVQIGYSCFVARRFRGWLHEVLHGCPAPRWTTSALPVPWRMWTWLWGAVRPPTDRPWARQSRCTTQAGSWVRTGWRMCDRAWIRPEDWCRPISPPRPTRHSKPVPDIRCTPATEVKPCPIPSNCWARTCRTCCKTQADTPKPEQNRQHRVYSRVVIILS